MLGGLWALAITALFVREALAVIEANEFPTAGPVVPQLTVYAALLTASILLAALPWWPAGFVVPVGLLVFLLAIVAVAVLAGPVAGPIAGFAIQVVWAYGAGRLAIRFVGAEGALPNVGFRALTSTGLGLGIQSHAIFVLGLLHALNAPVVGTVMVVGAGLALIPLARDAARLGLTVRRPARPGPVVAVSAVGSLGVLIAVFFLAASPEVYPDPVVKYLAWAQAFYVDHYLVEFAPLWSYFHLPFQLLSIPGFALGGETTGKFVPVFFGVATAATLAVTAAKDWGRTVGATAALLFFSTPLVIWCMGGAQSDLAVTYFTIASFAAVRLAPPAARDGAYRLAGLMAGFAIAMRVSALPFLVGVALVLIVAERPRLRNIAEAVVFSVIAACPWFILRFVQTGNPVFPLYNNIFRSTMGPPENPGYNFDDFGFGKGLIDAIRLPFDMTFEAARFVEAVPFGAMGASVLLSLAAPVAAFGSLRRIAVWTAPALVGVVAWLFVAQYLRYLLPALPFISTAAALVLVRPVQRLQIRIAPVATAACVAVLVVATGALSFASIWKTGERLPVDVVFGQESEEAFRARILPSAAVARYLASIDDSSPGAGSRVLKLDSGLFTAALSGRPATESWDPLAAAALSAPDADARVDALIADGYRWVVVHGLSTSYPNSVVGGELLPNFFGPRVTPVYARNGFVLYEIHAAAPDVRSHPIEVCESSFEVSPPVCWLARGSPSLSASSDGGHEAQLPAGSGYGQQIDACPGDVHRIGFRARPAASGDIVVLTLFWSSPSGVPLREDHRVPLLSTESIPLAVLSSAPPDSTQVELLLSSGRGTVFVDDVTMAAVSGGAC